MPKTPENTLSKVPLKRNVVEVCAHYAGPPKRQGRRLVFACPACRRRKLEALEARGIAGCFNAACPVPTTTDAPGLIAFFERLDLRADFPEIVRIGYEILGPLTALPTAASHPPQAFHNPPPSDPGLNDAVYRSLLDLCPTDARSLRFWRTRGVEKRTVHAGNFGAVTARTARTAVRDLLRTFGEDGLLSVPGFFRNGRGGISTTLVGDYALIPYHGPDGRIATVDGRSLTAAQARRTAKYVSLRDSTSHLYLFPGTPPDSIEAFCEGPIGAILAHQEGVPVGAIKGIRCHQRPDGGPLPELSGAGFGGRTVPYMPDADIHLGARARKTLRKEALRAARALTLPHGGVPAIAALPEEAEDLDSWLLALPKRDRREALRGALRRAHPLRRGEEAAA